MSSISIEFGALAAPIKDQLNDQGITLEDDISERFEKILKRVVPVSDTTPPWRKRQ